VRAAQVGGIDCRWSHSSPPVSTSRTRWPAPVAMPMLYGLCHHRRICASLVVASVVHASNTGCLAPLRQSGLPQEQVPASVT